MRSIIIIDGRLNPNIVGQSVAKLAEMFGIKMPISTKVIIGEISVIGKTEELSEEKLCPILGMYRAPNFHTAVDMADKLIKFGGPGHTSVLYTNPLNTAHIEQFGRVIKTVRVLINTPAAQVGCVAGLSLACAFNFTSQIHVLCVDMPLPSPSAYAPLRVPSATCTTPSWTPL